MWNTSARLSLSQKQASEIRAPSAPNINIVRGEHSEIAKAEKTIRHSSRTGFSTGMRHLAITCGFELISSSGIWTQPSTKGTLDAQEVWEWQLYSYQIRTANYPRGRASFFKKKNFHVHIPLRNPFQIFTKSKGYVSFFLFLRKLERRDTRADVGHWHSNLHESSSPLTQFWLSFVVFRLIRKVASTEFFAWRLHSGWLQSA